MKNLFLATTALSVCAALPAFAQTATPPTPDDTVEAVVVTGFRSSLQAALNLKREAIVVRDSIVAEDIGKFPEMNVAEALQRIPGVYLNRDGASNEGSRISVRGLGSQYSVTTLNGAPIHTTSSGNIGGAGRDFNFDVFASELFGRIDFYKTPLAELEEGGIGGVIDLQTPKPFDKPGLVIRYAGSGAYNSNAQKINPRGSLLFSDTFVDFGVLISYAHSENLNRRQGFQSTGSWNTPARGSGAATPGGPFTVFLDYTDPRTNLGALTKAQIEGAFLPRFARAYAMQNNRKRDGVTASVQYKPSDRLDVSVDALFSHMTDTRDENTFGLAIRNSRTLAGTTAAPGAPGHNGFVPLNVFIDSNNNLNGTFGNTSYFNESYFYDDDTKFMSWSGNAKYQLTDSLRLTGQATASKSKGYFTGNRVVENLYGVTTTLDYSKDPVFPQITSPASFIDPTAYRDPSLQYAYNQETDWEKTGKLVADWDYKLPWNIKGHLKAGVSRVETTKNILKQNGTAIGATQTLSNGLTFNTMNVASYMQPFLAFEGYTAKENPLFPKNWATFPRSFMNLLDPNRANRSAPLDFANSFETEEAITSFFIQSDFTGQVMDRELRMNVGVRRSKTETTISNYTQQVVKDAAGNIVFNSPGVPKTQFVPNEKQGKYTNSLPSVSLAYDLRPDLVWRASYGKSITRASLGIIAANTVIPNIFNPVATSGNPDLLPQTSDQYDTSLEWYFGSGAVLTVGAFKKTLKDTTTARISTVPFSSLGLDDSALGPTFQDPVTHKVDPNLPIQLSTFYNAGKIDLDGYEVAYQQSFSFLPAPFDGLGALASFTHINSAGNTWTANDGTKYNVSTIPKYSYSLTGYYEKGPYALRLSYNYKDKNILETSNNGSDFQRWVVGRGILDASVSYKVTKDIDVRLDALNLNNAIAYEYFKDPSGKYGDGKSRRDNALYDGRTILVGIRGRF
jgi:iron complex outermembrane receptor protein